MKTSGKQKEDQTEGKRSWKHKVKPCDDLDESSWWHTWKSLELREKKGIKHLKPRMWYDEPLRKEEIRMLGWNKNKNYVMRILHQFRLMTSNRFGILLILVEKVKIDIAQTWEGIDGTTGGIETMNKIIWEHRKRNLEQTAVELKTNEEKRTKHRKN